MRLSTTIRRMGIFLLGAGLAACDGDPAETDTTPTTTTTQTPVDVDIGDPSCEFLNPSHCLVPWPSSRYIVADDTTETGFRVELPASVMPSNKNGDVVDPAAWNRWDGFSPTSSMITVLPAAIDTSALATWKDPLPSLEDDSPTVLVDVESGERILHFAEIEEHPEADAEHPTLYIRPAARLAENRLYAVGIRGLKTPGGEPLQPARVFEVLRDGVATTSAEIEGRRDAFEKEVLEPLEKAGVARGELHEAWGFRTSSGKVIWGDMVDLRDDAMSGPEGGDLGCKVTDVVEDPADPLVFRRIEGTFTVPLYLDKLDYGGKLVRDAAGHVQRNGTMEAKFLAIVPRSVADKAAMGQGPFRVMIYGHGLFSDRTEIARDFMLELANKYDTVVFATETLGLSKLDTAFAGEMLQNLHRFTELMDRVRQGHVNHLLMVRAAKGSCAALPELSVGGASVVNAKDVYYWGNSQGGSFGQTLAALSPDIERFGLGVGGVNYAALLPRSVHWGIYGNVLKGGYPARFDRDLLLVMFAHHWDLVEGAAFAPHLLQDPLPGVGVKRVLMQIGLDDAQTPNVGSVIGARTIGLPLFTPSVGDLPGAPTVTGTADSAVVWYDAGAEKLPIGTVPPKMDTPTHEAVRRDPRAQAQLDAFLRPDGAVQDFCGGPCVAPSP